MSTSEPVNQTTDWHCCSPGHAYAADLTGCLRCGQPDPRDPNAKDREIKRLREFVQTVANCSSDPGIVALAYKLGAKQ